MLIRTLWIWDEPDISASKGSSKMYLFELTPLWSGRLGQYGHSGGTRGWLGVKRCQLCLQDTPHSAKWHQSQIWWYRLWGGNILMARPNKFLESRSWWDHDCGKFIYLFKAWRHDPIWYLSYACRKFTKLIDCYDFSELYSKQPKSEIWWSPLGQVGKSRIHFFVFVKFP